MAVSRMKIRWWKMKIRYSEWICRLQKWACSLPHFEKKGKRVELEQVNKKESNVVRDWWGKRCWAGVKSWWKWERSPSRRNQGGLLAAGQEIKNKRKDFRAREKARGACLDQKVGESCLRNRGWVWREKKTWPKETQQWKGWCRVCCPERNLGRGLKTKTSR